MMRFYVVVMLMFLLSSCATIPDKVDKRFDLSKREYLYKKNAWFFSGRMSVVDKNQALSADIKWEHQRANEKIKLSGPFGLGRTSIALAENSVEIDLAGKQISYIGNVDEIVSQELGITVPVSALKYWVLGLTDPSAGYVEIDDGFMQYGWQVKYLQMQINGRDELPRKIRVERGSAKLKLIVNYWEI